MSKKDAILKLFKYTISVLEIEPESDGSDNTVPLIKEKIEYSVSNEELSKEEGDTLLQIAIVMKEVTDKMV